MAANEVEKPALHQRVACSHPTTPTSGAPVRWGLLTGVALTDEDSVSGETTVDFGQASYTLSVKGVDGSGNSAVADGDALFYTDADSPPLSKKSSGYFFGIAKGTVGSGQTASIEVLHIPSPGAGTLGSGTVGTANLAANAVTAAKLSATLATGFIPVPLAALREIATNAIPNTAGDAGVLSSNTTPALNTTNGDTDSALRLTWAASNSDPVIFQVPLPPDFTGTAAVEVHLRAAMAGATDTPVIDIDSYFDEGDTKVEDASAAITGTSYAEYVITIAAADVPDTAQTFTCELTPAAHTTDALYVTAIWVEYSRA